MGAWSKANGQTIESEGPPCSVGECCEIVDAEGARHEAEVIGFRGTHVVAMPLEATQGIRYGDALAALGVAPQMALSEHMTGRVLDALGRPLDGLAPLRIGGTWPLDGVAPKAMEREPIREPLSTGVRVLDGMLTVGRGQRVGIFGGSGVGKSTLIGMMTRNTAADLTVVGLVGERGREVREFLEDALGEEGRKRSVVLVSTSDESPLLRMRAALAATSVAEFYASRGQACAAGAGFADAVCDGGARGGTGGGRTAGEQGVYAVRVFAAGAAGGAGGKFQGGQHHGVLHGADGGRRSAGPAGGRGALAAGWARGAVAGDGGGGLVSAR